jgi:Zn-dependent protease
MAVYGYARVSTTVQVEALRGAGRKMRHDARRRLDLVIPVIIAVMFHEAAHGFVARLLGDETAWRLGRVTFNR